MSKKSLERKADTLWRNLVREGNPPCKLCKVKLAVNSHHIMDRRHKHTKHLKKNGLPLCYMCHVYVEALSKVDWANPVKGESQYKKVICTMITPKLFDELEALAKKPIKYNEVWLQERIKELNAEHSTK